MLNKLSRIRDQLFEKLEQIEKDETDICRLADKSIKRINPVLAEIKGSVLHHRFATVQDEIQFFKEIKPSICSKQIYFIEVFNIESKRPTGSNSIQKKYFQKELKKLEVYFFENQEFYRYYRNKMTFLDDKIFVRGNIDSHFYSEPLIYDSDRNFTTSHDHKVSRIMANDLLSVYLNSELDRLSRTYHGKNSLKEGLCNWTESKIALVELIYALQAGGCISNGSGDIKEIAVLFESMFNIDLGDFYRTFLEIKVRQNPTKFLDHIRTSLVKRIEEQDG